jgi:hypothetical protein
MVVAILGLNSFKLSMEYLYKTDAFQKSLSPLFYLLKKVIQRFGLFSLLHIKDKKNKYS